MYETLVCNITGSAPLLMHNGLLANPRNPIVREMKLLTAKRKKTDEDLDKLSKLEWYGGLYLMGDGGIDIADGNPSVVGTMAVAIPGEVIESMMIEGAKKQKLGKQFKAGILSDGWWKLTHDGPKNVNKLWADERFVDVRGAKVTTSRVMRTRPVFPLPWSLTFEVSYLPDVVSRRDVVQALETAGVLVALCDYRPRFGRFTVDSVTDK